MRISWLSAEEIAAARQALTAGGAAYEDHFHPDFVAPPEPADSPVLDWRGVTEHVARAERVSKIVRDTGLEAARARFGASTVAIEAATLAAAAHQSEELALDEVIGVLSCAIDSYVFYAPFLELMIEMGKGERDLAVRTYEDFVDAYSTALRKIPHGSVKIGAVRDGLADFYVSQGLIDKAENLFETRHEEDRRDVAVALTASRAFLAAGSISHAVRWLGIAAVRAQTLGRDELADRLRKKQESVRKRMS